MKSIGGTIILHNAIEFDYCWRESILSMLPMCDVVIALECKSTDNTREELEKFAVEHPKVLVRDGPWNPGPGGFWLSESTNAARSIVGTDYHVNLQADEVFGDHAPGHVRLWAENRKLVLFNRLNFWGDHRHLIPANTVCGDYTFRAAPTEIPSVGDAESLEPRHENRALATFPIFHYGFLRHTQAYVKKTRYVQTAWTGSYDPTVDIVEKEGIAALASGKTPTAHPLSSCRPYDGPHPVVAHQWLKDRGYEP